MKQHFETSIIHPGITPDPAYGAVMPPIYQVSTYAFRGVGEPGPFDYSRCSNPTRKALEDTLAVLDSGSRAFAFATGMAAETTALALFSAGDHLVVHDDLYGGTWRLLTAVTMRQGIDVTFTDLRDPTRLREALRPNTKAIWFESVTNPLMNVVDIEAIVALARERGLRTICDNTFLSPYFFRPLEHGIDLVVHSTTKYINGHSDVVGGAIVARDAELCERIAFLQNTMGTCASPFDCFLVLRGAKTLPLRMQRHAASALTIARWLEQQSAVSAVLHPGLPSHAAHALAQKQFTGLGGTFAIRLAGGEQSVARLLGGVRVFTLAESLGGVESLIENPWGMTHTSMSEQARLAAGITPDLVRLSIGLEHPDDLISDLKQALGAE
ncbi:MAG TPA: PLP-dependent aspartate aminotransferase family protein [Polyangiaceae bacterium]|nr:PLP-dependent aspartate aminotransferase family protein [Polyangiaceae bacterium]